MISVRDLHFSYTPNGLVFSNFNLEIEQGSCVALMGPTGSGKTTLLKLIKGLLSPGQGAIEVRGSPPPIIGYIGADPYDFLVGITVEEDILFGLENLEFNAREMEERLKAVLAHMGLTGFEDRLASTLSGGEQQKLAIAGLLAMDTKFLLLDESTNMLDPPGRLHVRDLLLSLNKESGITILEVNQNWEEVRLYDRILFLDRGRVRYDGNPTGFLETEFGREWVSATNGCFLLRSMVKDWISSLEIHGSRGDIIMQLSQVIQNS
jgi:energy-coupling factor transport system ATP-binding protein